MCTPAIRFGSPWEYHLFPEGRHNAEEEAFLWSVHLRDDPKFPKPGELPSETLMRVDTICEAGLPDLDCAQDCFFAEVKHPGPKKTSSKSVGRALHAVHTEPLSNPTAGPSH